MKTTFNTLAAAVIVTAGLVGCATADAMKNSTRSYTESAGTAPYAKAGFFTEERDGRLWVFIEGSDDHKAYQEKGKPVRQVRRIAAGPQGQTLISAEVEHIDAYLAD